MILVTGASGFVGRNLVKELLRQNKKVRCFVRKTSGISQLKGAEIFYGDVTDKKSLVRATKGVSSVVHLAAITGFGDYRLNYKVHVLGAENLIETCKENNVKRIIDVSTVATLAERKSDYGITKALADDLFIKSGLSVTILKPDFIYGPDGRGFLELVGAIKRRKIIPVVGHGNFIRYPVHVDDVVAAIISSLNKKLSVGKTYVVASRMPLTFIAMVNKIMEKEGIKKPIIRLPVWLVLFAAYFMRVRKNPKITKTIVLGISQDRLIDTSSLTNELKVNPISFDEGLKQSLKKLNKH
ncbi:MAG: NAD-dependent epimerase/dehydratase family protein [Candidatus Aenigmarchaeota archaeon]|nr:NAD-dependent epimerase/dehydratase family protein [Candidatus Aenigmarchaeota archaeon]